MEEKLRDLAKKHSIEEIANILNIPYSTIWYNLKKYNIEKLPRPLKNIYKQFDTYTPESCYWAGFIGADGNVCAAKNGTYNTAIQLGLIDITHLEKFKKYLNTNSKISRTKINTCTIQVASKYMFQALNDNFNIVPNKTFILEPAYNIPENMLNHYIRGYFDGDGYIGYKKGSTYMTIDFACASIKFLEWILDIFKNRNFVNKNAYPIYKKKTCFHLEANNMKVLDIFSWLYDKSNCNIRLDRKYENYIKYDKLITDRINEYNLLGKRVPSGSKGFDLNYKDIGEEYLKGLKLNELSIKYKVSIYTLLANFKKLGIRKR